MNEDASVQVDELRCEAEPIFLLEFCSKFIFVPSLQRLV